VPSINFYIQLLFSKVLKQYSDVTYSTFKTAFIYTLLV